MGQALYRKYRPRSFSETVGQEAVTQTLSEAVKSGRISHAYLLAGPKGTGKTSIARILAHEINGLPYTHDAIHLDIIEIDAASNRRIDEIRDLREKVHITPSSAKYKVYIIDEVHMLTKEAFNALLKTLEEPPEHCIFILATTEAHKLPETIISRTQRFNFKPITAEDTINQLRKIAKAEKIDIEPDAIKLLAGHGEGSLRDIIGLLDQLGSMGKKITVDDVRNLIGIPPPAAIEILSSAIINRDARLSLEALEQLREQGSSAAVVAKLLSQELRRRLFSEDLPAAWVSRLLKDLVDVSASSNPQEILELAVLSAAADVGVQPLESHKPKNAAASIQHYKSQTTAEVAPVEPPKPPKSGFKVEQWPELLERIQSTSPSMYAVQRMAVPTLVEERLTLAFPFQLHQKKAKEARNLQTLAALIEKNYGSKLVIDCVIDKSTSTPKKDNQKPVGTAELKGPASNSELQAISNIFGSAEVLKS